MEFTLQIRKLNIIDYYMQDKNIFTTNHKILHVCRTYLVEFSIFVLSKTKPHTHSNIKHEIYLFEKHFLNGQTIVSIKLAAFKWTQNIKKQ